MAAPAEESFAPEETVTDDLAGGSAADGGDLSFLEAIQYLDAAVQEGEITAEKAERFKKSFENHHNAYLATAQNQKKYFRKLKSLKLQVQAQQVQVERVGSVTFDEKSQKGILTRELLKARMEQELAQGLLHEKMIEKDQLELELKERNQREKQRIEEARALLKPEINAARNKINELEKEKRDRMTQEQRLRKERKELEDRTRDYVAQREHFTAEYKRLQHQEEKTNEDLDTLVREVKEMESFVRDFAAQNESVTAQLQAKDRELSDCQKSAVRERENLTAVRTDVDRSRAQRDEYFTQMQKIDTSKKEAINTQQQCILLKVQRENELAQSHVQMQRHNDQLSHHVKIKGERQKGFVRSQAEHNQLRTSIPELQREKHDLEITLAKEQEECARAMAQLDSVSKQINRFVLSFVGQQRNSKVRAEEVVELQTDNEQLGVELAQMQQRERKLYGEINDLTIMREQAARQCTNMVQKLKEMQEELRIKQMQIADSDKQLADVNRQIRECEEMYTEVKNERNQHVNNLQQSQMQAAEFKDRLKIQTNEIEILRAEIAAKAKEYVANSLAYKDACTQRDALRIEVNKFLFEYEKMREIIDQQLAEIERLNATINQAESDMLKLKASYEQAVDDRNSTGIQLIDRNDELCILYEKSNVQEMYLRTGEIEIKNREEELRILKLKETEVSRQCALYAPRCSRQELEEVKTQIMLHTFELENEKGIAEKLGKELEDPNNQARFRLLGGEDPSIEGLYAKMRELEERLNGKEEQLLEKTLVLEEITNLSDQRRAQASEGRGDTLDLAKKVNDFQARIRDTTRKMMATVAELSIHQALSMQLQQEKIEKEAQLAEANKRLEEGQAPTADAAKEWSNTLERTRKRVEARANALNQSQEMEEMDGPPSQAVLRQTAYIPHHTTGLLPIKMPFFMFPPAHPTSTGSTMRHIVAPRQRSVDG